MNTFEVMGVSRPPLKSGAATDRPRGRMAPYPVAGSPFRIQISAAQVFSADIIGPFGLGCSFQWRQSHGGSP